MSETTYSLERDLNEAGAMAKGLENYVRGDQLYGSVGGGLFGSRMPSLTIGALLMRLRRLRAQSDQMTPEQQSILQAIEDQHAKTRREWTMHYSEKLEQEGFSRLKAMATFFEECADRPRTCASIYLPEALRRTIVQEIIEALAEAGTPDQALVDESKKVDGRLRRFVQPHPFIWADALSEVYPQSRYWWLYSKPPQTEREK